MASDVDSSSETFSLTTQNTESSTDTVWGIGTLSGRAIKSLGEASLRSLERLTIRFRLSSLQKKVASGPSSTLNVESIYDDLLELSRLDYYDDKVRLKALRMLMMQIGSRETSQLITCITKWPREEIRIFLTELMPCMLLIWQKNVTPTTPGVVKSQLELLTYYSSQASTEPHEIIPFLDFISQLSEATHSACRAVVEAKFLEVLVETCKHCNFDTMPEVISPCKSALAILLRNPNRLHVVCNLYRMDLVWPRLDSRIPLTQNSLLLAEYTPRQRKKRLRASSTLLTRERLCEIQVILSIPAYHDAEKDLFDLCFDLLELSSQHHEQTIVDDSFNCLLQCIAYGEPLWTSLRTVLTNASYNENLDFFYRLIYPLLRLKTEVLPTSGKFYQFIKAKHPDVNPVEYFMDFVVEVAELSRDSAQALQDAKVVSLFGYIRSVNLARLQRAFNANHMETEAEKQRSQTRGRSESNATVRK